VNETNEVEKSKVGMSLDKWLESQGYDIEE